MASTGQSGFPIVVRKDEFDDGGNSSKHLLRETPFEAIERDLRTLDSIGDAVVSSDGNGCITYLNAAAEKMTGWSRLQAIGRQRDDVLCIVDVTTREVVMNPMAMAIHQDAVVTLASNCILIRRDGIEIDIEDSASPIHDRNGKVIGSVMVFRDVTASRASALRMSYLARHDSLTGLPNRMLFSDRLTQAIALAKRQEQRVSVLFLDVDRFKHINDSFGHSIGDRLLQTVAQRLRACVRSVDTVSRQGGDEFVILLSETTGAHSAAIVATKILDSLQRPCCIGGQDLYVSASIGIATYPEDGGDAETLMKHADRSMYHAKKEWFVYPNNA